MAHKDTQNRAQNKTKIIYKELGYIIQGCCFEIRKEYGPGQKESVYINLLVECLQNKGIIVEKEKSIKIYSSRSGKIVGIYKPDLVIDGKIPIEVKSSRITTRQDERQIYHYLRNSKYELGYLVNFSTPRLFIKRIIYSNYKKPFLKVLSCIFVFLFVLFGVVFAQQNNSVTLRVQPPIFEINLQRGQIFQNKITIWNKSNIPIPLEAVVISFTASDESGRIQFGGDETDAKDWFKIEKPGVIVNPGFKREINFQISVPTNAKEQGYYEAILFKPKLSPQYFKERETITVPQIGVLFLISVGKKGAANFEIVEFGISEEQRIKPLEKLTRTVLVNGSYIPFVLRVKNNGTYHLKPSGILKIVGNNNRILGEVDIEETTILPGKIRQLSVNFKPDLSQNLYNFLPDFLADFLSQNFYWGKYKVFLELQGSGKVEREMSIWILPYNGIIILVLLVFLILVIIVKYNKKRKTKNKRQTTGDKQQTTNNRQQTTDNKQQTTNNKQQTTDNRQLKTENRKLKTD